MVKYSGDSRNTELFKVECPICAKRFVRLESNRLRINKHKLPDGGQCPGEGLEGRLVEQWGQ